MIFEVTVEDEETFSVTVTTGPSFDVTLSTGIPGPGVAAGGTTGQILEKKSDTDYDTEWVSPIGGRFIRNGIVDGADFSGSPKTYDVVFDTAFDDDQYTLFISSTDARSWTYSNKTADGFTIEANAAAVIDGEVSWFALSLGA